MTTQQLDERRAQGLWFNYDNKYSKGHKCGENKLFYVECDEYKQKEKEPPQGGELEGINATISCHALAGINIPKNLKIEGYTRNKRVTMLIDSGSSHNFVHYKVAKDLNLFLYPTPEFQVMIADGGTINYSRKFHNIKITMG